ncbi:hypothetical protein DY000_02030076 [Brassica cretica]|uniref:Uncharacterized protein n=1 Tax=Brassica cretica TaxID=69181 RepID=A0ABQ7DUX6_BRACR|nr:hypothetical protein DY000_02030076 [Brassica cretica]
MFERLCCPSQPDESFVRVSLASFEILLLQSKHFHFKFITFNRHLTPSTRSSHRCDLLSYEAVNYRRPTRTLWKGKMVIGKDALFVIMGLKRLNIGGEKLKRLKKTMHTKEFEAGEEDLEDMQLLL